MNKTASPRPAVHSMGAVSALGYDWTSTWQGMLRGESRRTLYSSIDAQTKLDVVVAAVPGLNRNLSLDGGGAATTLARLVLAQVQQSGEILPVYGGTNHGEADLLVSLLRLEDAGAASQWRSLLFGSIPRVCNESAQWVYGACASSLLALAGALQDSADLFGDIIVLATDALSAIQVMGFRRVGAISQLSCRPFHTSRDGLLIGEGAAALRIGVAERTEPKGSIHVLGIGLSCDAGHLTDPDPTGMWLGKAIDDALHRADLAPSDLRAIICHGTGTLKNDAIEASVIATRWPSHAVPITSIKGSVGHTMGVSGLLNVLVAVEASRSGIIPPTATDGTQTLPDIDVVRYAPRAIQCGGPVMALASGFGGVNAACIVGSLP
jgi:3-oxoacyl-[acyl-carrier-protein] synthase II